MAVNAFLVGLSDPKLIEHLLTQGPKTVSDAERVAVEYFQLRKTLAPEKKNKNVFEDEDPAFYVGAKPTSRDDTLDSSCAKN